MYKQCKTTDISKKLHNCFGDRGCNERIYVNLFDFSFERYKGNIVLFCLFNWLLKTPTLMCHNRLFIQHRQTIINIVM